jgi:hypothetical protein
MSQQTTITTPSSDTSDDTSDSDTDAIEVPDVAASIISPTEAFYRQNNQSMKYLVVLCEGNAGR